MNTLGAAVLCVSTTAWVVLKKMDSRLRSQERDFSEQPFRIDIDPEIEMNIPFCRKPIPRVVIEFS